MSKLPNTATENEIRIAHLAKMEDKRLRRVEFVEDDPVEANLGINHPNRGIHPVDNERRMREKVVDKSVEG